MARDTVAVVVAETEIDWESYAAVMSTEAIAEIMRLAPGGVRAAYRSGAIPAHHLGGRWIVFRDQFRPWLEASRGQAVSELPHPIDEYPAVLKYREIMRMFGVTKQTVYVWLRDGHLPALRFGDEWIVYKWTLKEMLPHLPNSPKARTDV